MRIDIYPNELVIRAAVRNAVGATLAYIHGADVDPDAAVDEAVNEIMYGAWYE